MFASTNLVLELGIVLWLLIGWQFAAAEFIGGAIMIALLAVVLPRIVPPAQQAAARDALTGPGASDDGPHGEPAAHTSGSWRTRIRPVSGMQVQVAHASATARFDGTAYHFCSDHCQQRFSAMPTRYVPATRPTARAQQCR